MAIKKYTKYIDLISHNMTVISTVLKNLYVDRITGLDSSGQENIIEHIGFVINDALTVVYTGSYRILNIYYDDDEGSITNDILNSHVLISSSFSKFQKSGKISLDKVNISSIMNIKPVVTYENIGDAHISAKYNVTLYDENESPIHGYEIYAPISSNSVVYSKEMDGRYSSRYGYVDDKLITEDDLLVERDDIYIFAIPINNDEVISFQEGIISILGSNASSMSFSGEINIINTDFTKINHTPIIKNISLVIYS